MIRARGRREGGKRKIRVARIEFENVVFSYDPKEDRKILKGISFVVEPGQKLALVGESGAGKSTIAKLLERFYDPLSGSITLDGVDLRKLRIDKLRGNIGIVSQEPLLFEASIADNIAAGRPMALNGTRPNANEIVAAAQAACAHEFIQSFPNGYATMVGGKNSLSWVVVYQ